MDNKSNVPTGAPEAGLENKGNVAVLSRHNGNVLCSWCRSITVESLLAPGGYMHAPSVGALSAVGAVPSVCALCAKICAWITKGNHSPIRLSVFRRESITGNSDTFLYVLSGQDATPFLITAPPGDPALDLGISAIAMRTTTASSQSFDTARYWLQKCLSHSDCSKLSSHMANDRPKRLVDLDAFGDYSTAVRLQDTSGTRETYAALSYCWGTVEEQRFTTTSSNLNSRMSRIAYNEVPKTFQHAFQISKFLGIRYLWIDALCILQDSLSDWDKESAKMGAIYSNSHLTIAADWSPNPSGGLYHPTTNNFAKNIENIENNEELIKITNSLSDGRDSSLYIAARSHEYDMSDVNKSVLNTRAWALQERLLSRRIRHYTDNQIYWECRSKAFAEELIPGILPLIGPYPSILIAGLRVWSTERSVASHWYDNIISKSYAGRKLTYASDRLPAVSALARVFSQVTNSTYLAGLWDCDLRLGLSWRVKRDTQPARRLENNCPSWSWASVDSDVFWMFGSRIAAIGKSFIHIQEASVQLEGSDPFGRVRGGCIRLIGRMKRCKTKRNEFDNREVFIMAEGGTEMGYGTMDTSYSFSQAYCLLLSSYSNEGHGVGLVLSLTSAERQEYKRLGIVQLSSPLRRRGEREPVQSLFQECTEETIVLI